MASWNPNANSVFLNARELPAGSPREAYLDEACGADATLRTEVLALLEAGDRAGSFLEAGVVDLSAAALGKLPPLAIPGDKVGPYKLLQEIGEGGMGLVFMAEQTEPVRRTVALKIIKPGMDTRQVIARFEAERQALALMDHPHIAKVLDGGTTDAGRPYFVMELVKGLPITTYCDEQRLGLRERLALFIPVCQAVQHAHQKGIIHRDLKPSNVMIALYDGQPVPKVIDFGVAKATGQRLTERTLFTEFGSVLGTFEYMSPEQAELNQLDVDTRSDVYSLGVLLYELTTGTTPLESERARSASFDEVRRIIREEEPPKPSTRLSSSANLPALAAQRRLNPGQLPHRVRGDLDWIIMKTIDKDRRRRYETANGLARDLERFLAGEPVEARAPSATYRFSKFAQRHRGSVAAGALILAALLVGIATSTWQAIRATRAESAAVESAQEAIAAADAERIARHAEAEQRRKAEDLTDFLIRRLRATQLPVAKTKEVDEIWRSAEKLKETLANDSDAKASLLAALARSHVSAGQYASAAKEFRECLEVAKDPLLVEEVSVERAHCLLLAGEAEEGSAILRSRLEEKLRSSTMPEAVELRAAWTGLATAEQNAPAVAGQQGLQLDGVGDCVILPDLQFDGVPPWTLEAIVRPNEIDQYSDPGGTRWTSLVSATQSGSIGLEDSEGKWSMDLYTAGSYKADWTQNYSFATAKEPPKLHRWQHVAGVWDGKELRLYLDGELQQRTRRVTTCTRLSEGPFFLGADPAGIHDVEIAQGHFHGMIRAARISHGVEYADSFQPPDRLAPTPQTLALYDFTIDTGRYAIDRSGHARHGIIVGAKFVKNGE